MQWLQAFLRLLQPWRWLFECCDIWSYRINKWLDHIILIAQILEDQDANIHFIPLSVHNLANISKLIISKSSIIKFDCCYLIRNSKWPSNFPPACQSWRRRYDDLDEKSRHLNEFWVYFKHINPWMPKYSSLSYNN